MATLTTNKGITKPAFNDANWNVPINSDWDIVDTALGGSTSISMTNTDVTLTQTQCQAQQIKITGALSANVNLIFPAIGGQWTVANQTTGAFTITAKSVTSGSTGVGIQQTLNSIIYSDGTEVYFSDNRSGSGATGGGTNQIFYQNDQTVTVDYSIPSTKNAMTAGPVTINSGVTVTVASPSVWTIV